MEAQKWYAAPRLVTGATWLVVILLAAAGFNSVVFRDGDFEWHRDHGLRFLARSEDPDHYLPARGLINVPLTVLPYRVTRAIAYGLCVVALLITYRLWSSMAGLNTSLARAAGFGAFFLLFPYVLRDLDECGLQLLLFFLLSLGGYALFRGWAIQAGFWLATAAVYKCAPLLCLPFLLWKRQWRAAAAMGVFLGLWCAAPALYSGWDHNVRAHERWFAESAKLKAAKQAYPSLLEREPQTVRNLSLYALIARNLETYPPGHPLHVDHPLFAQFGDLPPLTAYYVQHGILALIGLAYLWRVRTPFGTSQSPHSFPGEWASLCMLCALLAPLCWKQHLVLALPSTFLAISASLAQSRFGLLRGLLIALIAVPIFLNRTGMGGAFAQVLLSYKVDTIAVITLTIWAMFTRPTAPPLPGIVPFAPPEPLRRAA